MLRLYLILSLLLFLPLSNCNSKKKNTKNNSGIRTEHNKFSKVPPSTKKLKGLTKKKAIKNFGYPSSQRKFILTDFLGEFRIGLYNVYTKKQRMRENITIDEVTWEKDENTWITVWYESTKKESQPKSVYEWKKGSEF